MGAILLSVVIDCSAKLGLALLSALFDAPVEPSAYAQLPFSS